jgi:hypothetical protein
MVISSLAFIDFEDAELDDELVADVDEHEHPVIANAPATSIVASTTKSALFASVNSFINLTCPFFEAL